jgi:hypothetical protein
MAPPVRDLSRPPRWWLWPTVLSLDAPIVALLWQWEIAQTVGLVASGARAFVLGTSVWLAYSADRWVEGWRLTPERIRTQRHAFYQRRRWPVAALWVVLFAADVAAAFRGLSRREFSAGLALLGLVMLYLLSHQLVHRHRRWRVPKELCIAFLLGAGVALFLAPRADWAQLRPAAPPFALFVLLCFANCALISVWESQVDQSHGQTSWARQFPWGATLSRVFPWLLAGTALPFFLLAGPPERAALGCGLASCVLLGLVDAAESRLGGERARVLADVVLMTPAFFWASALLRR